jgi:beta-fructofuranosidase
VRLVSGVPVLVFTCHPDEQTAERQAAYGQFSTWSVVGQSLTGPWDLTQARPFTAEPTLFAAPLIQQRDGEWAFVGFLNQEAEGRSDFHICDPIPVRLVDGALTMTAG